MCLELLMVLFSESDYTVSVLDQISTAVVVSTIEPQQEDPGFNSWVGRTSPCVAFAPLMSALVFSGFFSFLLTVQKSCI